MKALLIANLASTWLLLIVLAAQPHLQRLQFERETTSDGKSWLTVILWDKPYGCLPNYGKTIWRCRLGRAA